MFNLATRLHLCSTRPSDAVRRRHERSDGTRTDGRMAVYVNCKSFSAGGEDGAETTARVRGIRGNKQSAVGQSCQGGGSGQRRGTVD